MQDPPAENITGSKRVAHTVEHRVDWGHLALGIGLLALSYILYRRFSGSASDESDQNVPGR